MSEPSSAVLITGATGFLGMETLARYLERGERPIVALVRAENREAARRRLDGVLERLFGRRGAAHRDRIEAVPADLTAPGLGLSPGRRAELAARVGTIIHCAASVSFTLPLAEARAINVAGTERVLELAELAHDAGGLDCLGYVSTAYVAGDHAGTFSESDHDVGQSFRNSYEQSKFEAERAVRSHERLAARILRPSIVVGDRNSGWTAAFNVLYWPLRALSRGLFAAVPAIPGAPVDVVSVDFVADAVHALCEQPDGGGRTYHLTAGPSASTFGEICRLASLYFRCPPPLVLSPDEFARLPPAAIARPSAIQAARAYFPYLSVATRFDAKETQARLDPAGITVSPLADYLERLLDFATRSGWGKRPIARSDALGPLDG